MKKGELAEDERALLQSIFDRWKNSGEWPYFREVDADTPRSVDSLEVISRIVPTYVRHLPQDRGDERLPLTLEAISECRGGEEVVAETLALIRWMADAYLSGHGLTARSVDAMNALGWREHQAVRTYRLFMDNVHGMWESGGGNPGAWEVKLRREIRYYAEVRSLVELRRVQNAREEFERARFARPVNGILGAPEESTPLPPSTSPRVVIEPGTAFILMWMDRVRPDLADVVAAIKEVTAEFEIVASRADDIEHADRITEVVLAAIERAELVIADLSGARPNVYYEVGYAHAKGKHPILVRKAHEPLHFDLAGYNVPEYSNLQELKAILRRRLTAITGKDPAQRGRERMLGAGPGR